MTTKIIGVAKVTCPICTGKLDVETKCPSCKKYFDIHTGSGVDVKKFGRIMVCDSCSKKENINLTLETILEKEGVKL
jgi:C4-type Zn-finger protein